jgi:hypothetical protein
MFPGREPRHCVLTLHDPGADSDLPRLVEVALLGSPAPWQAVWEHRSTLRSPLALWLRELAERGREPEQRLLLGSVGLPERLAREVAHNAIQRILEAGGGPWYVGPVRQPRSRRVVRIGPDGCAARFGSVRAAARVAGVDHKYLMALIRDGFVDRDGYSWFDDCAGTGGDCETAYQPRARALGSKI